jgi:hypothetical protein
MFIAVAALLLLVTAAAFVRSPLTFCACWNSAGLGATHGGSKLNKLKVGS